MTEPLWFVCYIWECKIASLGEGEKENESALNIVRLRQLYNVQVVTPRSGRKMSLECWGYICVGGIDLGVPGS